MIMKDFDQFFLKTSKFSHKKGAFNVNIVFTAILACTKGHFHHKRGHFQQFGGGGTCPLRPCLDTKVIQVHKWNVECLYKYWFFEKYFIHENLSWWINIVNWNTEKVYRKTRHQPEYYTSRLFKISVINDCTDCSVWFISSNEPVKVVF